MQRIVCSASDHSGAGALPLRIVALVPDPETCLSSLEIARAAALVDPTARITALHVMVDPARLPMVGAEDVDLLQLQALREGDFHQRRDETFRIYDEWLHRVDAGSGRVTWRERSGGEAALVDAESAPAHLVTIARPMTGEGHEALHAAIFMHRHLVLHTPPLAHGATPRIGEVMAIAWKPTEATRRAIFRAARWLAHAEAVHLITVEHEGFEDAVADLGDLGVRVQVHKISHSTGRISTTIFARAHEVGADSLVMGAYRRGAMLGWLLGGVTHDVLTYGDLPAFLVH